MNEENKVTEPEKKVITPEMQVAVNQLASFLIREYFENLHETDKTKRTNPVEVLLRSAIKTVIYSLGSQATPENVAAGLYEVLHIGDNIQFQLNKIRLESKVDTIAAGLKLPGRKRHKPHTPVV